MTTALSAVLGNDPVILSGTAFLVYFTKIAEVSHVAWIFSEFVTCNTASMLLFVGMDPCCFYCCSVIVLLLFTCSFTSFYLSIGLYLRLLAFLFWCGNTYCRIPFLLFPLFSSVHILLLPLPLRLSLLLLKTI